MNIRFLFVAVLVLASSALPAFGDEFYVMSVIQDFPMKQGEPIYRDFYVNAGTNNGLKNGIMLEAKRRLSMYDNINSKSSGDSAVKIAELKVIHVDKDFSIARLIKMNDKESTPAIGCDSVLIGDLISVAEK